MNTRHVMLVGFMGAGKSTVGRMLSDALGWPFYDLDDIVTQRAGRTVSEIFSLHGESTFRALEHGALAELVGGAPAVIACGGGVVLDSDNRRLLHATGLTVYLRVDATEALKRIGDPTSRPLLAGQDGESRAESLLAAREDLYQAVADVTIETVGLTARDATDAIIRALQEVEE